MPDLHQIPHLDEIAHHGEYHGVGKRVTETFANRYHHQNKVVPSLEDAIRLTGLRDGAVCITESDGAEYAAARKDLASVTLVDPDFLPDENV